MYEDLFIHIRHKTLKKINSRDILFVEADNNYSKFYTTTGTYMVKITMTQVEAVLCPEVFCRVHRTYLIPVNRITDIDTDSIYLDDKQIPLAKQYRENLLSRLKILP